MSVLKAKIKPAILWFLRNSFFFRSTYETLGTGCPANYKFYFFQKILGFNRGVPWPVHFTSSVTGYRFIDIGINTAPGASIGNYIFAKSDARIFVGDYTVIASNVCIGSFDHDVYNVSEYKVKGDIRIGSYCWVGANSVILSGVELGDHTVVAAGSVVNRSFLEGRCVLAGNPAKVVKELASERLVRFEHRYKYRGYKRLDL